MKIILGIVFGDNDFSSTYFALLKAIAETEIDIYATNKEKTLNIINSTAYCFYRLAQTPYGYYINDNSHEELMKNYLNISTENLLFGAEELDAYLVRATLDDTGNYATYILDQRVSPKHVYAF